MGVGDNAVRSRIKNGRLADAVLDDGSLDEALARTLWITNADLSRVRLREKDRPKKNKLKREAEDGKDEYDIKLERMQIALETERINLEKLKSSTIDLDEAKRAVRTLMRLQRDAMLNFANRYGPAIAAVVGCKAPDLVAELDARMRDALNDAAKSRLPFDTEPDAIE
jgi:hypothetical protein